MLTRRKRGEGGGASQGSGLTGLLYGADGIPNQSVMLLCFLAALPPISLRTCWQARPAALCVLLDRMAPPAVCDCRAISAPGAALTYDDSLAFRR
jgi:hypothetical protein